MKIAIVVDNVEEKKPLSKVNHSQRPVGSKSELTNFVCDDCGAECHITHAVFETADYKLMKINSGFDVGDIPSLCDRCAERLGYKPLRDCTKEEIKNQDESELHRHTPS